MYNKELTVGSFEEALRSIELCMALLRDRFGISRSETLFSNLHKLKKGPKARYANGYSDQAAIQRADKQND